MLRNKVAKWDMEGSLALTISVYNCNIPFRYCGLWLSAPLTPNLARSDDVTYRKPSAMFSSQSALPQAPTLCTTVMTEYGLRLRMMRNGSVYKKSVIYWMPQYCHSSLPVPVYQKFILHMVTKPTNAYKRIRVSYTIIIVWMLYLVRNILTATSSPCCNI